MAKILVCAATRTEANACLRGIIQGGLREHFEVLRTGIGPAKAAKALRRRLMQGPKPFAIISTGFAGSWSPEIPVGSWITADAVTDESGNQIETARAPSGTATTLCSVTAIHEAPPQALMEKLRSRGLPVVVDMESYALAQEALEEQVRFSVLRYVTDSPKDPLPAFVRHFTEVATLSEPRRKFQAFLAGVRSLASEPREIPKLLRSGTRWQKDLFDGWKAAVKTIQLA